MQNNSPTTKKKLLPRWLSRTLILLLIATIAFVAYNFIRDLNVTKVDQTGVPSVDEVREALEKQTAESADEDSEASAEAAETGDDNSSAATDDAVQTPEPADELPEPTPPAQEEIPEAISSGPRAGAFSGNNGYSVSGEATIVDVDGQKVLAFGDNFSSSSGPDLEVYLSKNNVQAGEGLGEFVSLSGLQANNGKQVYSVPDNIDEFQSVVIWCRAFSAQFGAADLQ